MHHSSLIRFLVLSCILSVSGAVAFAQETPTDRPGFSPPRVTPAPVAPATPQSIQFSLPSVPSKIPDLTTKENFSAAMQIIIVLTVLSLAPAILIMMTSFTRMIIVLSLLRQALGTQSLPPNQILTGLAMFMTFLVMLPTGQRVNNEAIQPYLNDKLAQKDALAAAAVPLREFMIGQIVANHNDDDALLFHNFMPNATTVTKWEDIGTIEVIPAFMLSELKTAFLMGFKIYLPFLIVDMVISSVLISMGMMMLPPALISLPFKLLLFVLVDGWRLITMGLMGSFKLT